MRLYRIGPENYLNNLAGLGSSYQDGARWNRPGQPALYFAQSAATAMLELANYLPSPRLVPTSYRLGIFDAPKNAPFKTLPSNQLPRDWAQFPHPVSTQTVGSKWLDSTNELGLLVPSAAVPHGLEYIVVINPRHPDCTNITLIDSTPELYNERVFSEI